ncbi:selenoprotein P-like [Phlebotomus papatasi]|uniref:selenoprotein P-like n=1 Tax=Phlebotomus papatasi TaxID=29031 RepID=UPI0024839699|nr:selenoprotein P-like [Phlebotomus papatasi]
MLNELRNRFEDAGFKSIHFVGISGGNISSVDFYVVNNSIKDIPIIHQSQHESLESMGKNQVYVIDHCSRLVYIIVPPWSFIQYPYVKASILSTIYDAPCGSCNISYRENPIPINSPAQTSTNPEDVESGTKTNLIEDYNQENSTSFQESSGEESLETTSEFSTQRQEDPETERENDEGFIIPIKVILPVEHIHHFGNQSTFTKYNYIVLRTDNTTYHGHLNSDRGEKLTIDQNAVNGGGYYPTEYQEITTTPPQDNFEEENLKEFEEEKLIFVNDKRDQYQKVKTYKIPSDNGQVTFDEVSPVIGEFEEFVSEVNSTQDLKQMDDHYEKLLQWLDYTL